MITSRGNLDYVHSHPLLHVLLSLFLFTFVALDKNDQNLIIRRNKLGARIKNHVFNSHGDVALRDMVIGHGGDLG